MDYELLCPNCRTMNIVHTDDATLPWTCDNCGSNPVTSFPTDQDGNLQPQRDDGTIGDILYG